MSAMTRVESVAREIVIVSRAVFDPLAQSTYVWCDTKYEKKLNKILSMIIFGTALLIRTYTAVYT